MGGFPVDYVLSAHITYARRLALILPFQVTNDVVFLFGLEAQVPQLTEALSSS